MSCGADQSVARWFAAVNLGQGFPDWPAPQFVKDAMFKVVQEDGNQVRICPWAAAPRVCRCNRAAILVTSLARELLMASHCSAQYTRSAGDMDLVSHLATQYSKKLGRSINALTEVARRWSH